MSYLQMSATFIIAVLFEKIIDLFTNKIFVSATLHINLLFETTEYSHCEKCIVTSIMEWDIWAGKTTFVHKCDQASGI